MDLCACWTCWSSDAPLRGCCCFFGCCCGTGTSNSSRRRWRDRNHVPGRRSLALVSRSFVAAQLMDGEGGATWKRKRLSAQAPGPQDSMMRNYHQIEELLADSNHMQKRADEERRKRERQSLWQPTKRNRSIGIWNSDSYLTIFSSGLNHSSPPIFNSNCKITVYLNSVAGYDYMQRFFVSVCDRNSCRLG